MTETGPARVGNSARESSLGRGRIRVEALAWVALALGVAFAFRGLLRLGADLGPSTNTAEDFFFSPSAVSPLLVGVVAGWLLANRRRRLRASLGISERPVVGMGLLVASMGLFSWAQHVEAPLLLLPSLMLALFGFAWTAGGRRAARAIRLPVLFLAFAIPFPAIVLNVILYPIQTATADVTAALLAAVGMPTVAYGDRIFRPGSIFQVIETCSGLRGTFTLLMAAVIYTELFPRSRRHRFLIVALTPLIGLIANEIRVISIVLNPYSHFSAVHTLQGVVVIVLGVLAIAGLDSILHLALGKPAPDVLRWKKTRAPIGVRSWCVASGFLFTAVVLSLVIPKWEDPRKPQVSLSRVPTSLEGWKSTPLPIDRQFLGTVHYSEWVHRRYEKDGSEVFLMVGTDTRLEPREDLLSGKTAIPGTGWEITKSEPLAGLGWGDPATRLEVENLHAERMLVVHFYHGTKSRLAEILWSVLAIDRVPAWTRPRAAVVRVSTPMEPGGSGARDAEERLREFMDVFGPATEGIVRGERPR